MRKSYQSLKSLGNFRLSADLRGVLRRIVPGGTGRRRAVALLLHRLDLTRFV